MRTVPLAILAGILVYCLPAGASAQQNQVICGPGQFKQNGVCIERPRAGYGVNPGPGENYGPGLPGYEGNCVNVEYEYINCGGTNTGRMPSCVDPLVNKQIGLKTKRPAASAGR